MNDFLTRPVVDRLRSFVDDGKLIEAQREILDLTNPSSLTHSQRDDLLSLHATLQDALEWMDEAPAFEDYRRKVIACLRSTEKVLGMEQSRPERKR